MRTFCFLILFLLLLPLGQVSANKASLPKRAFVSEPDFCRMYGSVYLERDPKRQAGTQYTIYEETEEAFANLVVFKENNKLFADAPGLWYLAPNRDFANFVVFVTPNRNLADFSVYFTQSRSFAGCKN